MIKCAKIVINLNQSHKIKEKKRIKSETQSYSDVLEPFYYTLDKAHYKTCLPVFPIVLSGWRVFQAELCTWSQPAWFPQ